MRDGPATSGGVIPPPWSWGRPAARIRRAVVELPAAAADPTTTEESR